MVRDNADKKPSTPRIARLRIRALCIKDLLHEAPRGGDTGWSPTCQPATLIAGVPPLPIRERGTGGEAYLTTCTYTGRPSASDFAAAAVIAAFQVATDAESGTSKDVAPSASAAA